MKPIPNEYLCPSEHGMNNARQISRWNGRARRPQRTPTLWSRGTTAKSALVFKLVVHP